MFKAKQKTVSLLVACLTMLLTVFFAFAMLFAPTPIKTASAAETSVTMSIVANKGTTSGSGASSQISWTQDGVTFVNIKDSSSTAIRTSDTDHYRVYKSSIGSITAPGNITKVVITSTTSSYVSGFSPTSGTKTTSGTTITVTDINATTLEYTSSAQWRLKTIAVTYEVASACDHQGAETSPIYDSATKEHYQQCANCESEIDGTRVACSDFSYGDYTTADIRERQPVRFVAVYKRKAAPAKSARNTSAKAIRTRRRVLALFVAPPRP